VSSAHTDADLELAGNKICAALDIVFAHLA
jgi:hypothetical protein